MKLFCHVNINIALKILLLFGFAAFFITAIFTGSVSLYVHPRIIPYMIFASVAMIIIAFLLFRDLFKPSIKKTNTWPLLFFIIPLIMAFVLPAEPFDSSTAAVADLQLSGEESSSNNSLEVTQKIEESESFSESSPADGTMDTAKNKEDDGITLNNGIIVMDSNNYYKYLCAIYANHDKYKGTPIEAAGFVFKEDESLTDNEFVSARLLMVCCAADMQTVGLLCSYDKASELETDSWIKVSGTIEEIELDGETVPCIVVQTVEKTEEPDESYVYPY